MRINYIKYFLICCVLISHTLTAQVIKPLTSNPKTSLRGISPVNDNIIWVCGSKGYVGRSVDGGKTWIWIQVPNYEKTDFRAIIAFDEDNALIMATGEPGYILRTGDGGLHWKAVYTNKTPGIFLDAMSFWDKKTGIVVGDPILNKFIVARTWDGGRTWHDLDPKDYPDAKGGEALFAASGTNIRTMGPYSYFVTGGTKSKLYRSDSSFALPISQGKPPCGANSIALKNYADFIVVGGDYSMPDLPDSNCCITKDGGRTWSFPQKPPHGYRSCVEYLTRKTWICCGLNGVDITENDGRTWKSISTESYNVCRISKKGSVVFLAGSKGNIAMLQW